MIRYGRLAAAGVATPRDVPQAVARAVRATAETVRPATGPAARPPGSRRPSGSPPGWSSPGSRIMEITGDWMWPLHAVLDHDGLVRHALAPTG